MPFDLSIVSPEGKLVECAVDSMVAPGSEGEFGVLPGHELYIIPLTAGTIRYREGNQEHEVEVSGGFVEVTQERVTVLAQVADGARAPDSR